MIMVCMLLLLSLLFVLLQKETAEAAYSNGHNTVYLQAHRGYSGRYPENTLVAFSAAICAGADLIELDVRLSQDGEVFVMHDATMERTTNGSGPIAELTAAQVNKLDAGSWFDPRFAGEKIPTLAQALDCCRDRVRVNIELKVRNMTDALLQKTIEHTARVIDQLGMWDQVLLSSFQLPAITYAKQIRPQATVALIDWDIEGTADRQLEVLRIGGKGWFIHPQMVNAARVALAHERGLMVTCGAGNNAANRVASVLLLLDAQVDTISTNYTAEVVEVLAQQGFHQHA